MSVRLKKFELLVRETSKVNQKQIISYLNRVFHTMEQNNTKDDKTFGFATVFDARTSEYYLYYSDNAKAFFKMSRNRYDLVPKGIITEDNLIDKIKKHLSEIKDLILGSLKIRTVKATINNKGEVALPYNVEGDIVFNTAEVQMDNYYEDYIVTLRDGRTLQGLPPELAGKEVIVSYLSKE